MAKPPKIVIPGLNRGAGIPPGYVLGRPRGTGKGPAMLLNLTQMRAIGVATAAGATQSTSLAISTAVSLAASLSIVVSGSISSVVSVDTAQSTSLSQISSSLSGAISTNVGQSTSLSQISSSLSGAISSTSSLSTAVSTVISGSISSVNSRIDSLSAAGGGGATTFLALTDTPDSYAGQAAKVVRVNAGETGLEFAAGSVDPGQSTSLSQISSSLSSEISSRASGDTSLSTVISGSISTVNSRIDSLSTAISSAIRFSGCKIRKSTNLTGQNLTAGQTFTANTEDYDTDGYHDNVTNNDRLTVPAAGYYAVSGLSSLANVTTGNYIVITLQRFNSSAVFQENIAINSVELSVTGTINFCVGALPAHFNSGDFARMILTVEADTSVDITTDTCFGIQRIVAD